MNEVDAKREYLRDLDLVLQPHGFGRSSREQQWRCRVDDASELWININFGKAVVNPSLGVSYLDLLPLLPQDAAPVTDVMKMLPAIVPPSQPYTIDEGSGRVVRDLEGGGIPFLSHLIDRLFVVEKLRGEVVADWPTISYSHRIRLLPLLVASQGNIEEARNLLDQFVAEAVSRDQIVPGYDVFAAAFKTRFPS